MKGGIISFKEVIGLRKALVDEGIPVTVHLHDTCGGQSFSFEVLDEEVPRQETLVRARAFAEHFLGRDLAFSPDGESLWGAGGR